ncbi:Ankyrin repeat-containing protein [Labeo rohita]|uniref:Ankyrin repeat-containing protein n=1 Tax=Labeo rohita TaxID=84645 RepID=A0ABQ8L3U0_LABRO|nr:Ankyrin repeat-containing protein [Labeo rohita]
MIKPARLKCKEGENVQTRAAINTEVKELGQPADHDYAMEVNIVNKRKESAPTTPSKIPVGKKSKPALMEARAVQYNADEVKDCKEKISDLEKCNERLCKENKELKERMREQERCKMRPI